MGCYAILMVLGDLTAAIRLRLVCMLRFHQEKIESPVYQNVLLGLVGTATWKLSFTIPDEMNVRLRSFQSFADTIVGEGLRLGGWDQSLPFLPSRRWTS